MRFMIIVKSTPLDETGALPDDKMIACMATYHEELVKAGVLLDANGLQPSSRGWRVRHAGRSGPSWTDRSPSRRSWWAATP